MIDRNKFAKIYFQKLFLISLAAFLHKLNAKMFHAVKNISNNIYCSIQCKFIESIYLISNCQQHCFAQKQRDGDLLAYYWYISFNISTHPLLVLIIIIPKGATIHSTRSKFLILWYHERQCLAIFFGINQVQVPVLPLILKTRYQSF